MSLAGKWTNLPLSTTVSHRAFQTKGVTQSPGRDTELGPSTGFCGRDSGIGALLGSFPRMGLGGGGRKNRGPGRGHLRDHSRLPPETRDQEGEGAGPGSPWAGVRFCAPLGPGKEAKGGAGSALHPVGPHREAGPRTRSAHPSQPLPKPWGTLPGPGCRASATGSHQCAHLPRRVSPPPPTRCLCAPVSPPPPKCPCAPPRAGSGCVAGTAAGAPHWRLGSARRSPAAGGDEVGGEEGRPRRPVPHPGTALRHPAR